MLILSPSPQELANLGIYNIPQFIESSEKNINLAIRQLRHVPDDQIIHPSGDREIHIGFLEDALNYFQLCRMHK